MLDGSTVLSTLMAFQFCIPNDDHPQHRSVASRGDLDFPVSAGKISQVAFSVSAATRSPRSWNRMGKIYYLMSEASFLKKIMGGELVEWGSGVCGL